MPVSTAAFRGRREPELSSLVGSIVTVEWASGEGVRAIVVRAWHGDGGARLGVVALDQQSHACVSSSGTWFSVGGRYVSLSRFPVLGRLLSLLAEWREARPGECVPLSVLAEAAWPGQRLVQDSARRRLRALVFRLRNLGLREHLESRSGYALALSVEVERTSDAR